MRKLLFGIVACLAMSACGKKITGQVFGDYHPFEGALVATDSSPKTVKTGKNGYFSFRVKSKEKACRIIAWVQDTTQRMDIITYTFNAGKVDLRITSRNKAVPN